MTITIDQIQLEIEKSLNSFKIKSISSDDLFYFLNELSKEKYCIKFMNQLCSEVESVESKDH